MHIPAIHNRNGAAARRSLADPRRGPAILVALAIALGAAGAVAASDEPAQPGQRSPRASEFGGRAAPIDRDAVVRAVR